MTREEALQEAVRAMRHERNLRRKCFEAPSAQAFRVAHEDYEAAVEASNKALKIVDDMQ